MIASRTSKGAASSAFTFVLMMGGSQGAIHYWLPAIPARLTTEAHTSSSDFTNAFNLSGVDPSNGTMAAPEIRFLTSSSAKISRIASLILFTTSFGVLPGANRACQADAL